MLKLKYNILAGGIVLIQLLSLALLFWQFGASDASDIFLFSLSMAATIQLIEIMFIEQFMFFYHDILNKNQESAKSFYQFAFTLAGIIGIFMFLLLLSLTIFTPELISFGLEGNKQSIYIKFIMTLSVGLLLYPILAINDRLLNAKNFFALSYLLASSMHIFLFIALLFMVLIPNIEITFLGWGYSIGIAVGALSSSMFIWSKFSYGPKITLTHVHAKKFILKSLGMRFGHNIFMVLFYPLTNFFLTQLPSGSISLFYYVYRTVIAIFSVTAGPSHKIYMAKLSLLWSKYKFHAIKLHAAMYLKNTLKIYIFGVAFVFSTIVFILPEMINRFQIDFDKKDLLIFQLLYLLISGWQMIILFESTYVGILIASHSYKEFITVNILFIVLYFLIVYFSIDFIHIYALGFAAIFAQIINLYLYRKYALQLLKRTER